MQQNASAPRRAALAAQLPLYVAFLAAPLAILAGRLAGRPALGEAFGPRGLAPWLCLAGFAVAAALTQRLIQRGEKPKWPVFATGGALALLGWVLARVLTQALAQAEDLAPLLAELRLPALIAFALLWGWSFGPARRESLAHAGAALGALMTLDFLLTAIMARGVVPGGGYLFGDVPGTADLLACLLCAALAATAPEAPVPGVPRLARWLILAGLFASGSKAGLLSGAALCLLAERGPFRDRLATALAMLLALWASVALPLQHQVTDELGLDWYYAATAQAVTQDARALLTGLPLDGPVALAMPEVQGLALDPDYDGVPVSASQIPVSWLRLLAGWGILGPLAVLAAAGFCLWRGRGRFAVGLTATLCVGGALAPVLHAPATATVLAMAFVSAAIRPEAPRAQDDAQQS